MKNPPTKKALGLDDFIGESYQMFKEEITPVIYKLLGEVAGGTTSQIK